MSIMRMLMQGIAVIGLLCGLLATGVGAYGLVTGSPTITALETAASDVSSAPSALACLAWGVPVMLLSGVLFIIPHEAVRLGVRRRPGVTPLAEMLSLMHDKTENKKEFLETVDESPAGQTRPAARPAQKRPRRSAGARPSSAPKQTSSPADNNISSGSSASSEPEKVLRPAPITLDGDFNDEPPKRYDVTGIDRTTKEMTTVQVEAFDRLMAIGVAVRDHNIDRVTEIHRVRE